MSYIPYLEHLVILICIYIILAVSLNLVVGFTGMLNLGHAAFFAIGAYTSAILVKYLGFPFLVGFIASFILAALAGLLIGIPCLRLRGDYLAIATLGFGEIIRAVLKNWISLTRGPLGIPGIPKPSFLGFTISTQESMLIFSILIMLFTIIILYCIVNSPFGRTLKAIREDEIAAQALGKNTTSFKLKAFFVSAGFAGIAGSIYAHYITFIDPSSFTLTETVLILLMVVLGGMNSFTGSIVGAIILVLLPEPLRLLHLPSNVVAALRQLIYAILLIIFVIFKPEGIIKEKTPCKNNANYSKG